LTPALSEAQIIQMDSVSRLYARSPIDSIRYQLSRALYNYYENTNLDSASYYIEVGLLLARKNKKDLAEATVLISQAYQLIIAGRYAASLQNLLIAFSIIEKNEPGVNNWILDDPQNAKQLTLAYAYHTYANLMTPTQNFDQQIYHYKQALKLGSLSNNAQRMILANLGLGRTYMDLNRLDSALLFETEAERLALQTKNLIYLSPILSYQGAINVKKGNKELARSCLYRGIDLGIKYNNRGGLAQNYFQLTNYYLKENAKDSALFYAKKFERLMNILGTVSLSTVDKGMAYENVYRAYLLNGNYDSAFIYQGRALIAKDSLYEAKINSLAEFQNLSFGEQMRLQELQRENEAYRNKILIYTMLTGLCFSIVITVILYQNNNQKKKANKVLEETLSHLKSTQSQLIQSEKMASLGELTTGIAHEIQNPLNFVNNFSEVSNELIGELKTELATGNRELATELANDISGNLEKINHHGKRAADIVKGMLQHSRSSSGVKEPTDINALADEYLRLAYHGLRAKDKSFNSKFETVFDESIGKVNVIPQDIGRVILNLITNAFYVVYEKSKQGIAGYEPTVSVSTKKEGNKILVNVKDNGNGIPQKILDKIFQPFFTTKPTGQGTGLGLSLSYDIVKAHGGELKMETKEEEGSTFTIQIPLS
jgi:signal transduction histidine kinase